MGLDQYIYREYENKKNEDGINETDEIYYWRKNYALNDWACDRWCPDDMSDFNCERLYLTQSFVEELITHILFNMEQEDVNDLYHNSLETKDILETFMDCKKRLDSGQILFYYAWW